MVRKRLIVSDRSELPCRLAQIRAVLLGSRLIGELGQTLKPELASGRDFVALLSETNREQAAGEFGIAADLGGDAEQQGRLAAAARSDDDLVLVRVSGAAPEGFDDRLELVSPHAERRYEFVLGQESRVELTRRYGHRFVPWRARVQQSVRSASCDGLATNPRAGRTRIDSRLPTAQDSRRARGRGAHSEGR